MGRLVKVGIDNLGSIDWCVCYGKFLRVRKGFYSRIVVFIGRVYESWKVRVNIRFKWFEKVELYKWIGWVGIYYFFVILCV